MKVLHVSNLAKIRKRPDQDDKASEIEPIPLEADCSSPS